MNSSLNPTALQLRSLVKSSGELVLSLDNVATPEPSADQALPFHFAMERTVTPPEIGRAHV